ncbi:MAG: aminotransferase class IV [Alicyclobacillus sp.]|nr:aminotransferase class IV [Alicyclobacillus sp.]
MLRDQRGIRRSNTVSDNFASAGGAPHRVRLRISSDGRVWTEAAAAERRIRLTPTRKDTRLVALARAPVSREDPFLFHKTTRRDVYEERRREFPEVFDVLLWNEQRELTEFTNGNLVFERNGQWLTPPRECGLLAGTFRAELLEAGAIREQRLTLDDLQTPHQLWFVNSVRGWVPVRLP